jgi:hypothetical protein
MIDGIPYIVVDNQKISPIGRAPGSESTTDGHPRREDQTFGVVDRVTISSEARQMSKQALFDPLTPPSPGCLAKDPRPAVAALLTYAPNLSVD